MRLGLSFSIAFTCVLIGCGGSSSSSNEQTSPPNKTLPEPTTNQLNITTLNAEKHLYSSDLGYKTLLERVVNLSDKKLLIVGEVQSIKENGMKEGFYVITDLQGKTYHFEQTQSGFIDACAFDSGEYVIGRFVQQETDRHSVMLERYNQAHELVQSTQMMALSADHRYDIPLDEKEWQKKPFTIASVDEPLSEVPYSETGVATRHFNWAKFTCHNENLYITYNNGGQKISKYNASLQPEWHQPVAISYWGNSARESESLNIAIADDGTLYSAQNISTDAIPAYNHKFNTEYFAPENATLSAKHIIYKAFNPNGVLIGEQFIINQSPSFAANIINSLTLHQDKLIVGRSVRLDKTGKNRYTSEWDIGLVKIDLVNHSVEKYWYDIDKEDRIHGIEIYNDTLYLYGNTGGVQVDTGSWVEYYDAFIGEIDLNNLNDISIETISTERAANIHSLTIKENILSAVGVENAPITHSADGSMAGLFITKTIEN